jgi:hypothetical protein
MTLTTKRAGRLTGAAAVSLALLAGAGAAAATLDTAPVLADNFESGRGMMARNLLHDPHLDLAEGEGVGGGRALRATYVGGPEGSARIVRTLPLTSRGPEYSLNYDVKFGRDFQFVRGGKLHGLAPDRPISGGRRGGGDSWSVRAIWQDEGGFGTYVYQPERPGRYGERGERARPFRFEAGRYYAVTLHVRLNDPVDASNGLVRLYVDGDLVAESQGLRLRSTGSRAGLISRFMFSTFHGGNDPSYAPRTPAGGYAQVHAYFDNFAVYPGERVRARPGA